MKTATEATRIGGNVGRIFARATALAGLSLTLAFVGCAPSTALEGDVPQDVADESVEEATAGGPVRLASGNVPATAHVVAGGYVFVSDQDLDADCDARAHIRRVAIAGNSRSPGEEVLTVIGSITDIEAVGDQLYYSVLGGCGLTDSYIARRPIAGGAETIVYRVAPNASGDFINGVFEFAARGTNLYALVSENGRTSIRKLATTGGTATTVADFSTLADAENMGFMNLQVDDSAIYVHEENNSALWRIPHGYAGELGQLPTFPNVRLSVGDYALANGKVYFVASDLEDRIMVRNSDGTGSATSLVYPGAGLRQISDLNADAGNVYFYSGRDRSIYRFDMATRRIVRLVRSITLDTFPDDSNISFDGANLYWMQQLNRTNREEGVVPMRLARTWGPRG